MNNGADDDAQDHQQRDRDAADGQHPAPLLGRSLLCLLRGDPGPRSLGPIPVTLGHAEN